MLNRSFILRLPDGYDRNRQYRLVFGFHWWGGTAVDVASPPPTTPPVTTLDAGPHLHHPVTVHAAWRNHDV